MIFIILGCMFMVSAIAMRSEVHSSRIRDRELEFSTRMLELLDLSLKELSAGAKPTTISFSGRTIAPERKIK